MICQETVTTYTNTNTFRRIISALTASIVLGVFVSVWYHKQAKSVYLQSMTQEAETLLVLTNSYVSVYSDILASSNDGALPVPAHFRALSADSFNSISHRDERFVAKMVGMPASYIKTPPVDQHMSDYLNEFSKSERNQRYSDFIEFDNKPVIRTIFPLKVQQTSCADCHNKMQANRFNWQVGDYMGAYFIDRGVADPMHVMIWQSTRIGLFTCLLAMVCFMLLMERGRQKQLADKMREYAYKDPLTGSLNRRALHEKTHKKLLDTNHSDSLLILDIDHFKKINDQHSHQVGDQVLISFVRRIESQLRHGDLLSRIGGEEFVIYLSDVTPSEAASFARRLCVHVAKYPILIGDKSLNVTTSIGCVSIIKSELRSIDDWIAVADRYLYQAKKSGRNKALMPFNMISTEAKAA